MPPEDEIAVFQAGLHEQPEFVEATASGTAEELEAAVVAALTEEDSPQTSSASPATTWQDRAGNFENTPGVDAYQFSVDRTGVRSEQVRFRGEWVDPVYLMALDRRAMANLGGTGVLPSDVQNVLREVAEERPEVTVPESVRDGSFRVDVGEAVHRSLWADYVMPIAPHRYTIAVPTLETVSSFQETEGVLKAYADSDARATARATARMLEAAQSNLNGDVILGQVDGRAPNPQRELSDVQERTQAALTGAVAALEAGDLHGAQQILTAELMNQRLERAAAPTQAYDVGDLAYEVNSQEAQEVERIARMAMGPPYMGYLTPHQHAQLSNIGRYDHPAPEERRRQLNLEYARVTEWLRVARLRRTPSRVAEAAVVNGLQEAEDQELLLQDRDRISRQLASALQAPAEYLSMWAEDSAERLAAMGASAANTVRVRIWEDEFARAGLPPVDVQTDAPYEPPTVQTAWDFPDYWSRLVALWHRGVISGATLNFGMYHGAQVEAFRDGVLHASSPAAENVVNTHASQLGFTAPKQPVRPGWSRCPSCEGTGYASRLDARASILAGNGDMLLCRTCGGKGLLRQAGAARVTFSRAPDPVLPPGVPCSVKLEVD